MNTPTLLPSATRAPRLATTTALAVTLLAACGGGGGGDTTVAVDPQAACSALQGLQIPAASIGTPNSGAVVQSTTLVKADASGNTLGEYCAVKGLIIPATLGAPNMQFQVNLPSTWNERALQMGGGAYDGTLVTGLGPFTAQPPTVKNPLAQGFVTLGSDGGHQSSGNPFDGTFALNDEALVTFGQRSVKKARDVAMVLIEKRYAAKPKYFYFIGGSQGGHEALDAAARYSADYDGVLAHYPAYNISLLQQASLYVGQVMYANGGAAWLNPAKKTLLTNAVYAACDGLDGAADGIIANLAACRTTFKVESLRCAGGSDAGNSCLSDAQIAGVKKIAAPFTLPFEMAGQSSYPGWPILDGALFNNFFGGSAFGATPQPSNPPGPLDHLLYSIGAAHAQYFVAKNPALDALGFDPTAYRTRLQEVATITDVTNVSLEAFRAKGGKVILTHGTIDTLISQGGTTAYYQRQVGAFGQAGADSFIRYYVMPGWDHGFGPFNLVFDGLAVLQNWAEKAQAPADLVGIDGNPGATRTRPLCQFPKWPRFSGASGASVDSAANFTCVTS